MGVSVFPAPFLRWCFLVMNAGVNCRFGRAGFLRISPQNFLAGKQQKPEDKGLKRECTRK
jgi:hypothetical protein